MADMTTTFITEENVGDVAKTIRDAIAKRGSASKLTKTVTIWGKSFDGSSDINDGIDVTSYIILRDSARTGATQWSMEANGLHIQALSLQTGADKKIFINENGGNIQIGNTSKSAKLAIGGTLHADGNITGSADITASGNVIGMSGVSAKGIADFDVQGTEKTATITSLLPSDMIPDSTGIQLLKQGGRVTIQGLFTYTYGTSTSAVKMFTIPDEFMPNTNVNASWQVAGDIMWRCGINKITKALYLFGIINPATGATTDTTSRMYSINFTYII